MSDTQPMGFLLKLLKNIRENILEQIVIPGINISWWEFVLGLIVVGILITVLINSVRVSSDNAFGGGERARRVKAERVAARSSRSNRG